MCFHHFPLWTRGVEALHQEADSIQQWLASNAGVTGCHLCRNLLQHSGLRLSWDIALRGPTLHFINVHYICIYLYIFFILIYVCVRVRIYMHWAWPPPSNSDFKRGSIWTFTFPSLRVGSSVAGDGKRRRSPQDVAGGTRGGMAQPPIDYRRD